ncbi:FadR/GntR family transcriptional regulator [Sphingomonas nostoxanthinifaciens]|uniref:FadR/GntR family transcriptional regulator n=1 Tax=Sphingomonas nostoxanthinifaciens TaxID=2872652 RepID=UPI001CC1E419|nr:FadR/GntR family transcriptional regulator [Sphingomonas nostoxanthinifaciens]UAK26129.1 FadR family transcriptional regulator [Sphingomonas nostoxanthinifaciens]
MEDGSAIDRRPRPPLGGPRFHGSIARELGTAILSGRYPPGTVFSGEIAFAERLNVSRSVYREAVRMLVAKGLVESRPKAGTMVTDRGRWNLLDPEVLAWSFEQEPSPEFVRDLFELRFIIEPAAAALAARRRTEPQLAEMTEALETMARHSLKHPEGQQADQRFHRAVLRATGNAPLASLSSGIEAAVSWTTIYKQRKHALPRDAVPDHRRLLAAIGDADPEAARAAMTALIALALEDTEVALGD